MPIEAAPQEVFDVQAPVAAFEGLRSFKCHNWAYAIGDLADVVEHMERVRADAD